MPREPRHYLPGATYHVICRGNHQQPIFRSNEDYRYFCALIGKGTKRFDHSIIAYCLMTNHIHLAVQVGAVGLSTILHTILFRYAQVFNAKYNLSGHLFQGRFQSELVDTPAYFHTLIRYIHLNPVKAGIVDTPDEYPWSSFCAYSGTEEIWWLSPKLELSPLAGSGCDSYLDDQNDLQRIRSNQLLDELLIEIGTRLGVEPDTLQLAARHKDIVQARAIAAIITKNARGITLKELARRFRQTPSALSKAASRVEAKLRTSTELHTVVSELSQKFASL